MRTAGAKSDTDERQLGAPDASRATEEAKSHRDERQPGASEAGQNQGAQSHRDAYAKAPKIATNTATLLRILRP